MDCMFAHARLISDHICLLHDSFVYASCLPAHSNATPYILYHTLQSASSSLPSVPLSICYILHPTTFRMTPSLVTYGRSIRLSFLARLIPNLFPAVGRKTPHPVALVLLLSVFVLRALPPSVLDYTHSRILQFLLTSTHAPCARAACIKAGRPRAGGFFIVVKLDTYLFTISPLSSCPFSGGRSLLAYAGYIRTSLYWYICAGRG